MKLIDNLVEKVIMNKLKSVDFEALVTKIINEHKDAIIEAIQSALCKLLNDAIEKVNANRGIAK